MDIICYGAPRELITYLITIVIAGVPSYVTAKYLDGTAVREPVAFVVFIVMFYFGLLAGLGGMHAACGFSPDQAGLEQDRQIIELRRQIEEANSQIRFLEH